MSTKKSTPNWANVKAKLTDCESTSLIGLLHDLYAADKNNQVFLHARLGLGDPLEPYKETISRWICPDVMLRQNISVSKAKKAIADYKKAAGCPEGLAELSIYYCETVFIFFGYCGVDEEGYYTALVRMFERALKATMILPKRQRDKFLARLDKVRVAGQHCGWGVGDDFNEIWQTLGAA